MTRTATSSKQAPLCNPCTSVYLRPTNPVGHLEQFVLTKHLYCCTGTMAQLPTYRLTTSPDCFFTRLNCFRTTGNNDGRPFFARLICFRTTDKFGGIPCRICIAILIHIKDRYDDLVHITPDFVGYSLQSRTYSVGVIPYFFRKQRLK